MKWYKDTYRIGDAGGFGRGALYAGILGLGLCVVGYFADQPRFFHAWLTAYAYWLSLALGALFFVMLHHLTGARWSVVIRRLAESLTQTLPLMALLFLPLLLGMHDLYHWSHHDAVAADAALQKKAGFLNVPFFVVRSILYLVVWIILSRMLYRLSLKEDTGYQAVTADRMRRVSGLGMVLYAFSATYAGFDWLMSLDPHWYSTIFGVIFFASGLLGAISLMALMVVLLRRNGILVDVVTEEHRHDLGKLMLAFTIFWTYVSFSQYFLIWYGNIPEETVWYLDRWVGSWKTVSLIVLFGHFAIPFVALLFRATKRNAVTLGIVAVWLLVMHWIHMYWLVYPTLLPDGATFSWIDLAATVGIGGLFVWMFWLRFVGQATVPVNDPKLAGSISHVNPF
ncbi:MAG: hypothetical protein AB1644_10815 [Candidatus Zixiibacteriota bacterium]